MNTLFAELLNGDLTVTQTLVFLVALLWGVLTILSGVYFLMLRTPMSFTKFLVFLTPWIPFIGFLWIMYIFVDGVPK